MSRSANQSKAALTTTQNSRGQENHVFETIGTVGG
jgi:hypothetical protein